jgi:hypothetical protein
MSLDVSADEVEFLTPRNQEDTGHIPHPTAEPMPQDFAGFTDIQADDIPF